MGVGVTLIGIAPLIFYKINLFIFDKKTTEYIFPLNINMMYNVKQIYC